MFANGDVVIFLLAILTLRGLMRLHPQQMPRLPSLISLRQILLESPIRRCIPRCSTRTERLQARTIPTARSTGFIGLLGKVGKVLAFQRATT